MCMVAQYPEGLLKSQRWSPLTPISAFFNHYIKQGFFLGLLSKQPGLWLKSDIYAFHTSHVSENDIPPADWFAGMAPSQVLISTQVNVWNHLRQCHKFPSNIGGGDTKQNREQINRKRGAYSWFSGHKWFPQALKRIFNQTGILYNTDTLQIQPMSGFSMRC